MQPAPSIPGDEKRVAALRNYRILDTLPEKSLDDLTALASYICATPMSLISLVDEKRQWFKSRVGTESRETPRDISFCGHVVAGADLLVVPDASKDKRFADNPLVTGGEKIRFYAGAPLVTPDGHVVGTLCVMDRVPRRLKPEQMEALLALARQVMAQLELRRRAREIAEGEERLRTAMESARLGMFDWDVPADRITWSKGHESLWGFAPGEFGGSYAAFAARVHPDDLPLVNAEVQRCIAARTPFRHELRVVWPDGSTHWIEGAGEFAFNESGAPLRMRGVVREVTERKRSEESLQLARYCMEHAGDGIFWLTPEGGLLYANKSACATLGYTLEEIQTMNVFDIDPDFPRDEWPAHWAGLREIGTRVFETRHRTKDGRLLPVEINANCVRVGNRELNFAFTRNLTERKRADAALRERRELLRLFVDHSPAAVAMFDLDMKYLVASRRWIEDYKLADQPLIGRAHYEVFPEIPERWREIHRRCLAGASESCEEDPFGRLDGSTTWLRWEIKPWHRADGSIGGIIIFTEDITPRKRAEAAVRESEQQYRLLFASNPQPMWLFDLETLRFLAVNNAAVARYGFSRDEFLAMTVKDIRPAEDIPRLLENLHSATGDFQNAGTWRHRKKCGDVISVEITSHKLVFNDRMAELVLAMDVTSRVEAERRLAHLNRVYAVLSDINQAIVRERDVTTMLASACRIAVEKGNFRMAWIGMLDATGRLVPVSSAGVVDGYLDDLIIDPNDETRAKGPTSRALLSGAHILCADIESDPLFAPWRERALARGYRASAAFPLIVEGKAVGTFSLYASEPGFFDEKETQLLDELAADISFALEISHRESRRRVAEEELRWRTAFFEAQVESALDGLLVVDTEGRKILQNERFNELWKIPPDLAAHPDDRVQLEWASGRTKDPEQFVRKVEELYASPVEVSRDIIEQIDGTVLERGSSPVRDKAGKHYGRIWTFRDITNQRKLESQLRQSQKMEAIGQLAGGVAHDFNNILAAIMMQADLASSAGDMPSETREMLEEIKAAAERAANLTRQLLAFSRRQVMQPRVLDLNEVVTNVAKMFQRILGEDIRLQFNLHPRPLLARADAGMLDQVLLNLVVNARDAMPDGGNLTINTGVVELAEEESAAIPESTPGPHVCVGVSDTGSGIAPEHLPRIFEPFFTTKEPGKGTGLGLATVFGIIKQHGGALKVESDVGRGTLIEFMLPAIESDVEEVSDAKRRAAPRGGTETVLLVEDDPAVRMLTRIVLESRGYKIIEAESGPAALKAWEQAGGDFDLLFTDLVMPEGIGGHSLAAELQALKPGLKVIFTSGYSADIAGRELELKPGQNFIQKPCPPAMMLEIVRHSLDS